ncbi:MAG: DUF4097 family beta strand repeat-containing protein [Vagococcus sp.]|uniref:DUF4097 family beta strand repeat-containing protein n=1 Tax=Vagococcus TaxID=2737 RepID=UPI002FC8791E
MKKRIWFVLIVATLLIITGAAGSIYHFQKLEAERAKSDINKKFKYDNSEELVLNIKNRASLYLSTSEDDYVHMKKQGLSYGNTKKDETSWDIKKEGNKTTVTIDNQNMQQRIQPTVFNFGDIYDDSISLSLPENYKKITINGNSLDIHTYELTLSKLDIKTKYGFVDANDLITEELTIESHHGDVFLNEAKIEKDLNIDSTNGNITIQDASFMNLKSTLKNGDIVTGNTKGNMDISNTSGNTYINHTKGTTKVDNKNGDVIFHSNQVNYDTTLESVHGTIFIEIDQQSYDRNKMDFATNFGVVSIFNENLSSETKFSKDKGTHLLKATSKNGDITVNELDEDDTEYDSH